MRARWSTPLSDQLLGELVGDALHRALVVLAERAELAAVDVDLPEDVVARADEHDHLGTRVRAAREVVVHLGHVGDVLVLLLGDRGAAHACANRNAGVLGRRADVVVEPELVLLTVEQVHADPIEAGVGGLDPTNGAPEDRKSTRLNSSHSQISYAV